MAKVSIKRRSDKEKKDGTAALYAVLYVEKQKIRIPLDISVLARDWDPVAERIKGRGKEISDRNLIIADVRSKITEILVKVRLSGEKLTRKRFFHYYRNGWASLNYLEYAHSHLAELRPALTHETYRHHISALKKLEAYAPELMFSDITLEWLRVYAAYLRDEHRNCSGTINKNMSIIRMHYMAAMRAGLVTENPFELYKLPPQDPAIVYLTEEELNRLIRLYRSGTLRDVEQDVLRFFLFMTFTAMHISDAGALQIEQILNGEIHYRRIKTGTKVEMPLSKSAAKLVEYYRAGRYRGPLIQNLPSQQAVNRLIKIVCARVGIEKAVSAKAGRHTFATLYYIKNSGDLGTLSKLLGHTSINTTMIYAHIMKESRVAGVAAFDDML